MARRYLVQTDFNAKDGMSPAMKRMNRGFGRFAANITDGNSKIGRSFGRLNKGINRVVATGFLALTAATGLAAKEYISLDQTITGANARFKDTVIGTEQATENMEALTAAAREVGRQTQFTATESAAGLNFYAKAGFTTAEAMAVLADTVDLATVAEADFNRAADISSDLLGALGKNVQDSAQKIQNLKDINRALGLTANAANVDLEDMFETLKIAGPIASKAGEEMHQLFAITGALGGAGIKGSMAATALKNAYTRLAAPTKMVTEALDKLNLQQSDFIADNGKMKSMVDIMKLLGDASAGLGDAAQLGIFAEIFGKNAVAGATNLADSLTQVEEIFNRLESEQKLQDIADEIRKGLGNQILILKSGLLELGLQFIETFDEDGRGALQGLIDVVQNLDITPITKFASVMVEVFKFIGSNWKLLLSLAAGIKAVSIALGVITILTEVFGLTLAATPIGKIIVIVALLVTALVWLALNWDKVTNAMKIAWKWTKALAITIGNWLVERFFDLVAILKIAWEWIANVGQKFSFILGPIGFVVSALIEVIKQWDNIRSAFQSGGFISGILSIGKAIFAGLLTPLLGVIELAQKIPGMGDFASGARDQIQSLREELLSFGGIDQAATPTPITAGTGLNGSFDINFNNAPEGMTPGSRNKVPAGVNLNFSPMISQ